MAQYIDKAALDAEIERRIKEIDEIGTYLSPKGVLTNLLCSIDTLEVKEVNLEEEIYDYANNHFTKCGDGVLISDANSTELTMLDIIPLAKHFFELGLKTQKGGGK